MNRVERLYAISEIIRQSGRQPVSASSLAERFGVSRRTIERDLASLREAGVPLVGQPGRNGGFTTLDQGGTTVVALSPVQVTALLVAVSSSGPDAPYADDALAAADLLAGSVATGLQDKMTDLRNRIRTPDNQPKAKPRVRRTTEEAVRQGRVINVVYIDAHSKPTERSVHPSGFYRGTDGWHLIGWCELREAGRIFRLDRIQSARLTNRSADDHELEELLGWTPQEVAAP